MAKAARGSSLAEQVAHVVADAGETLQAALPVEQVRDRRGAHALLRDQVEHDAGIELARARAHRQAVERGEAHGALDAAAVAKRAHRGAAAEMGDDDAAARDSGATSRSRSATYS